MPRRSTRNLLRLFAGADVDDQSIGPDVSDGIQLVYVADDLQHLTRSYGAAGGVEAAFVAEGGAFSIQCRNERGLIIDGCNIVETAANTNETTVQAITALIAITGPGAPAIQSAGPQPEAIVLQGTAPVQVAGFRWLNLNEGMAGWFVPFGATLTVILTTVNVATAFGIRWHELSRS